MSKEIKSQSTTNKTWEYKKRNMSLSFTINIDIEKDLKDFREILKRASSDISDQIENNL